MNMIPAESGRGFAFADGIARMLLIGLAFLFPFFVIPLPFVTVQQSKVLLLCLALAVAVVIWAFARIAEGVVHVPRSWLVYAALLLPVAYLASTIVTGWSAMSLVGYGVEQDTLASVILMTALFLVTTLAFYGSIPSLRLLIQGFVFGCIALFGVQTLYIFFPSVITLGGLLTGETANVFGSWHDLGILAGLAVFLSLSLWNSGFFVGAYRYALVLLGILASFILVIVHFRDIFIATAILFALAGIAVAANAFRAEGRSVFESVRRSVPWIIGTVLLGAAAIVGVKVWDKLPEPIRIVQTEVRPSWQGTFDIAKQSLQEPTEFIFGVGPNSFIREWGLHKPSSVNLTPFWDSDFNYGVGIIPTSVFTAGAIGFIAWAAIIAAILVLFVRFIIDRRALTPLRSFLGVALLSAGYLVAYHMIYTPGSSLTAATFFALGLLALASGGENVPRPVTIGTSRIPEAIRLLVFVVLVLIVIAAAALLTREVVSNIYLNKSSYTYSQTSDAQKAGADIGRALLISPRNDRAHRAAAELGIIQLQQKMAQTDPSNQEQFDQLRAMLQTTIQHGLTAVSINDTNYQNWLMLAQVYGNLAGANVDGALEQARSAYQKAFEAHPTNPTPKYRLAQIAIARSDMPNARTLLNEAIQLKPDFAAAYFLLSQVEAADGKGDAAVQAAYAATQLVPQDPLGWFNLGYILYSGGSYTDAGIALQQAITLAPDYSNAMFFLGLSLYQLDRDQDAALVFDQIARLNPTETWLPQVSANIRAGRQPMEGINGAPVSNSTPAATTTPGTTN